MSIRLANPIDFSKKNTRVRVCYFAANSAAAINKGNKALSCLLYVLNSGENRIENSIKNIDKKPQVYSSLKCNMWCRERPFEIKSFDQVLHYLYTFLTLLRLVLQEVYIVDFDSSVAIVY